MPRVSLAERRKQREEGLRAALIGPERVGTAHFDRSPVPTFSALCAPVLELADRRDLQSRAHSGRPGPIPGWGIPLSPNENRDDNSTLW